MFGNAPQRKQFSYTSSKNLKPDENKDLRKRMKFTSYSSQDSKPSKKKMIFFAVLLLIALSYILNYGFRSTGAGSVKLEENELEKING